MRFFGSITVRLITLPSGKFIGWEGGTTISLADAVLFFLPDGKPEGGLAFSLTDGLGGGCFGKGCFDLAPPMWLFTPSVMKEENGWLEGGFDGVLTGGGEAEGGGTKGTEGIGAP